jgi:8-amino-7-oxononanoate synthase
MELEEAVAQFKGTERALVFNSGYQANVSILAALLGPDDWVFSDRINHASIVDGCLLSRARLSRYQHNDVADLEKKLQKAPANALKWIVTDTVFSMDGDIAPLTEITELAQRYGARVLVDEAHGTGIFGRRRRSGVCEAYGLTECVDLHMGTFSKGLGGFGAYIAGSGEMMDYLINKARGFIYSTALPPSVVATAHAAIELVQDDPSHTQQLWSNIRYLEQKLIERFGHDGCKALGIPLPLASQIVPVVLGPAETTMRVCEQLLESGLFVQGIRPPTVPDGSSRLRISLSALHTPDQINRLAEALAVCIQPVTP